MELDLQIIKDPCRDLGKQSIRVFGERGGVIGRALDCYWLLPDPKRYLSGHHCTVARRGDVFWLTDTSRNGVFVNDDSEPIGYLNEVKLHDGDRLGIGLYKVLVRFRERAHSVPHSNRMDESHRAPAHQAEDADGKTITIVEATGEHEIHADDKSGATGEHEIRAEDLAATTGEHEVHAADRTVATGEHLITGTESTGNDETAEDGNLTTNSTEIEPTTMTAARGAASAAEAAATVQASTPPSPPTRVVNFDRDRLQALGHLPPKDKERLLANQFRHIKRSLLANAIGRGGAAVPNGRLIMMTSALPGEGKTFSTLSLALSIARERSRDRGHRCRFRQAARQQYSRSRARARVA